MILNPQNLKKFFRFDEKGLNLGKVEYHDTEVKLNLTKLLSKHLAILAQSGAGKSYFTSTLLEELLERKKEQGRVGIIVLDVHGEYSSFAESGKATPDNLKLRKICLIDCWCA